MIAPIAESADISGAVNRPTLSWSMQVCDGAIAALIVSERSLKIHNLKPVARIHTLAVTASDPVMMLFRMFGAGGRCSRTLAQIGGKNDSK
jgi:acetyl-CoA acetyltransferase